MYKKALKNAKKENFYKINATILIQHYGNIKRLRADELSKKSVGRLEPNSTPGLWLCGAPGLGKSFFAQQFCQQRGLSHYLKPCNKWWDGYEDEDIVIIEDVDKVAAKFLTHLIKIWCDEGPFRAETKGASVYIRPRGFIVTSNYTIDFLWGGKIRLCRLQ